MLSPRAYAWLRRGWMIAILATAALATMASADPIIARGVSQLASFLGYVPDEFVVEFRRDVAHALRALTDVPGRGRANSPDVQALLDAVRRMVSGNTT